MGDFKLGSLFFSVWDWVVDLGFLCFFFCFSVDSKLLLEFGFE